MTTMLDSHTDLIARLQEHQAAVGAARSALNDNTARASAAFQDKEQKLGACISGLTSTPRDLDAEQARLAKLEEQRATVLAKQTGIENALIDAPDWRLAGDAHARDEEYNRQHTLKMQLQRLREGTLLFAPNQVYERVDELDAKVKESNKRIEVLRAHLAAHLQRAEALLGEVVTR